MGCGAGPWHPQLLFAAMLSSVLDKPSWAVSRLRCLCAGEAVCELQGWVDLGGFILARTEFIFWLLLRK